MEETIYIYHTAPNQRSVITKKTLSDDAHLYGKCNVDATLTAARELSDRAFKMYVRMNLNQDKYSYALSPAATEKEIGMSEKRYRLAVQELIEKGYLVQHKKHKFLYYFYEAPHIDNANNEQQNNSSPPNLGGLKCESERLATKNSSIPTIDKAERDNQSSEGIQHYITSDTIIHNTDNKNIGAPSVSENNLIQDKKIDCSKVDLDDTLQSIELDYYGYEPKSRGKVCTVENYGAVWDDDSPF